MPLRILSITFRLCEVGSKADKHTHEDILISLHYPCEHSSSTILHSVQINLLSVYSKHMLSEADYFTLSLSKKSSSMRNKRYYSLTSLAPFELLIFMKNTIVLSI